MRTITGLYDTYEDAERTIRELEAAGVPHDDISVVASNADNRYSDVTADERKSGAGTGATLGTVLGGGAGLLAGLGMLAIPGVGPVVAAGWLVATAVGAGAGALTGGLLGSLTSAGVSEEHAHVYAEGVRRGGTLVTARVDDSRAIAAEAIMKQYRRVDPDVRGRAYRDAGWTGFNDQAPPYTPDEVERERERFRSTMP